MSRNALRASMLGKSHKFESVLVDFDGLQFEIREPSVRLRGEIQKAAKIKLDSKKEEVTELDFSRLQVAMVINCTYVPGTNELVFEPADFEALAEQPGRVFDVLAGPAIALLNTVPQEAAKK